MRKKTINFRIINHYFKALENEVSIDEYLYDKFKTNSLHFNCFPRPSKWLNKSILYSIIIKFISKWIKWHWKCYLYHAFIFTKFIIFGLSILFTRKIKLNKPINHYLLFSGEFSFKIIKNNTKDLNGILIQFPWHKKVSSTVNKQINLLSLLTIKDIFLTFQYSIIAFRRAKKQDCSLHYYTSFTWFLTYLGISKLKGKFTITEHYDRWAYLISSINYENKLNRKDSHLKIIQHGILTDELKIKNKILALDEILFYDFENAAIFLENYVTLLNNRQIVINYQSNKITIEYSAIKEKNSILLIGHPICIDFHVYLLLNTLLKLGYPIYYKPHPANPSKIPFKHELITVVKGLYEFPKVGIVISYPSTLERIYSKNNIISYVHDLSLDVKEFSKESAKIENFILLYNCF